jgi:bacteriocin biosynthesis cyclodehydratase domain-containing protein
VSRIRLTPSASITRTARGVVLGSDLGTFQITGDDVGTFLQQIAPLLDGSRDGDEVAAALPGYAPKSVAAFLDLLRQRGLIEDVPEADPRERWHGQEAFFRRWSGGSSDAMDRLAAARVLVAGLGAWGATAAVELAAAGLGALHLVDVDAARRDGAAARLREAAPWCRTETSGDDVLDRAPAEACTLLVAAVPRDDAAAVERVARFAHRAGLRSLWSHLAGATAVVGPRVTPGRTACAACAEIDTLNTSLGDRGARAATRAEVDVSAQILGHLVAMEAITVITEYVPSNVGGHVIILDPVTLETSHHRLVRLPWCRVCGEQPGSARPKAA